MKKLVFCLIVFLYASSILLAQTPDQSFTIKNRFTTGITANGFIDDALQLGLYDSLGSKRSYGRLDTDISFVNGIWGLRMGLRAQGGNQDTAASLSPSMRYGYVIVNVGAAQMYMGVVNYGIVMTKEDNRQWSFFNHSLLIRPALVLDVNPIRDLNVAVGIITHRDILANAIGDNSPEVANNDAKKPDGTPIPDMGANGLVAGFSYESPFGVQVAAAGKWTSPQVEAYAGLSYSDPMKMLSVGVAGYGAYLNDFATNGNGEVNAKVVLDGTKSHIPFPLKVGLQGYYHMFGSNQTASDTSDNSVSGPSSLKIGLSVDYVMPIMADLVVVPRVSVNYATYRYMPEFFGGEPDTFPVVCKQGSVKASGDIEDLRSQGVMTDMSSVGGSIGVSLVSSGTNGLTLAYCPYYLLNKTKPLGRLADSSPFYHAVALGYAISF